MPSSIDVPRDQFVSVAGLRLHYLDWGSASDDVRAGEPLLLLAGLGCTAHVYAELAPHLTDRYRVIALSRRGHGLSGRGESGYSFEAGAEDARALLDELGTPRAHVVGHSMGGGEASTLAARHPDRVASVVYLDGAYDWADSPQPEPPEEPAPSDGPGQDEHDQGGQAEPAGHDRFASYDDFAAFVRSSSPDFQLLWGPAFEATCRTLVEWQPDGSVTVKLTDTDAAPFVEAIQSYRHPYAEITAPALAIYAVGDRWQGAAASWRAASRKRFATEMTNREVLELRDASHYLFLDHRDDVVAALRAFLP